MNTRENDTPINVAVFIDYENVYKALLRNRTNLLRLAFFEKLRKWCSEHNRRIVRMAAYCNFDVPDLHESYHQSILQSYGIETVHTSNQGKNYADLKIAIDVLTSMYSNDNIDEFFIMSNDKDMIPLLNTIRANKRNVAVITAGPNYNPSIREFADRHIKLEDICEQDVEHKIIDDISSSYLKKLDSYSLNRIEIFRTKGSYNHLEIMYHIIDELKFIKVMSYELATIIKGLHEDGKVFFYRYKHGPNIYIGIASSNSQQDMLTLGIIQEADILGTYNMQKNIDALYNKYI